MALGKGADRYGKTTPTNELIMNQFETAGRLSATSKKFGLALYTDDGTGSVASTTTNFADFGNTSTPSQLKADVTATVLNFNDNEFYWKTDL